MKQTILQDIVLDELKLTVEFYYTPPDPGNISGPPENCWPPADEEFEINCIWWLPDEGCEEVDILPLLNKLTSGFDYDKFLEQIEAALKDVRADWESDWRW